MEILLLLFGLRCRENENSLAPGERSSVTLKNDTTWSFRKAKGIWNYKHMLFRFSWLSGVAGESVCRINRDNVLFFFFRQLFSTKS